MPDIIHKPCPFVSCGSSDAFSYHTEKKVGKCHSCGESYPSRQETSDGRHLPLRGILQSTMQDFNVLTYDDRQEYVYPSGGIKVRKLEEKSFYAKDGFKGDELFGMNLFPAGCSRIVTITEVML